MAYQNIKVYFYYIIIISVIFFICGSLIKKIIIEMIRYSLNCHFDQRRRRQPSPSRRNLPEGGTLTYKIKCTLTASATKKGKSFIVLALSKNLSAHNKPRPLPGDFSALAATTSPTPVEMTTGVVTYHKNKVALYCMLARSFD